MEDRELIGRHRIYTGKKSAQVAVERIAFSPDRLWAWQGRAENPTREWRQRSLETVDDFIVRVRSRLAEQEFYRVAAKRMRGGK